MTGAGEAPLLIGVSCYVTFDVDLSAVMMSFTLAERFGSSFMPSILNATAVATIRRLAGLASVLSPTGFRDPLVDTARR
jgi:hypothetical protein